MSSHQKKYPRLNVESGTDLKQRIDTEEDLHSRMGSGINLTNRLESHRGFNRNSNPKEESCLPNTIHRVLETSNLGLDMTISTIPNGMEDAVGNFQASFPRYERQPNFKRALVEPAAINYGINHHKKMSFGRTTQSSSPTTHMRLNINQTADYNDYAPFPLNKES